MEITCKRKEIKMLEMNKCTLLFEHSLFPMPDPESVEWIQRLVDGHKPLAWKQDQAWLIH